ncbi:MAG TPA: GNAT family protein, partial [Anaerolineales bacterium]
DMDQQPSNIQPFDPQPVTLIGHTVRLEPLSEAHIPDLAIAGKDEEIWRYMLYGPVINEKSMQLWVKDMLQRQARGTDLPFAVIHLGSGRAIGATRYMEIRPEHRGLEIGGTWYALAHQRTAVNTESKYLLLQHAFETLSCIRVQFKTDLRNERSQRALERIGAVWEGVLRNHMILGDGVYRHSVYYSILIEEWPSVKGKLEVLMAQK